jgi:hypothetical protein
VLPESRGNRGTAAAEIRGMIRWRNFQAKAAFRSPPRNRHACLHPPWKNHLEGIVNSVVRGLPTGKLEGTNNMIKTSRRMACGFHDTPYFFWKIMENSHNLYGHWESTKILCWTNIKSTKLAFRRIGMHKKRVPRLNWELYLLAEKLQAT